MDSSVKSDVKEEYPKQSIEETDQNNGESVELQSSDVEVNAVRNDCESDQKSVRFHKITNFFPVLKQEGRAKMCSSSLGDAKQNEILQKLAMSKESATSKQFSHVGSSSSLKASLCPSGVATALKSIPSSDSQHTLRKPSSLPLTRMVNLKMLDSVMKTSISKVLRTKMEASEGKRDLSERARMSLSGSSKDKMTVISEESLQICKQEAENTHLAHSLSVKHKMKAVISEKSDLKKENIINNNICKLEKSRECSAVDDELTEIHACSRARKSTPSHSAKSFTSTAGSKQSSSSTHFEITTQLINAVSKFGTAEQSTASEPTTLTLSSEPTTLTLSSEPTTLTLSSEPTTLTLSSEPTLTSSEPTLTSSVTPLEPPSVTPLEPPSVTPLEPPSVTPSEPPSETPSEPPSETPSEPPSETPSEPPSETASEPSAASHLSLVASEPSTTALHPLFEASELPSAALQPQTPQSITLEPTTALQQVMGATSTPPAVLPQSNSTTSGIVSRNQTVVHSLKVRKTKRRHFKGGTYNLYLSPAKKRKKTLKKHFDSSTSVRDDESSVGGTENGSFLDSEEENSLVSEDCYTPSEKSLPDEEPVSEPQCTSPILPTDKSSDMKTIVKNVVDICGSDSKCDKQPPDSIANPELEYVVKLEIDEVAAYDTIDLVSCEEVGDSNCKNKSELETGVITKEECDYAFNEQSDNIINEKDNICEGNKIDFEIPLNNDDYHHVKPGEMVEISDAESSCKITDEASMKQPSSNINAGINKIHGEITRKSEDKEQKDQSNECEKNSKSIEIFSPVVNETINCEKFVDKISLSVSDSACVIPENFEKHGCCTSDISSEISVPAPNVIKSQDDAMARSHDDVSKDSPISTIATSVKSRQRIKRRFTDDIVDTDAGIMSLNSLPTAKKSKTEQQSDIIENFLSASSNSEAKGGPVTRVECVYDSKLPPVSNCTCQASPIEASIGKEETSVYCQAVDSIDDKLVGCCNPVLTHHLVRPSVKIPFTVMCEMHLWRLKHHHCCPGCGLFCSQGDFFQCSNLKESKKQIHLYHERCQVNQEDGQPSFCPHCGGMFEIKTVHLELHMPTPPTFYLSQRPLLVIPKARITFCKSIDTEEEDKSVPERSYTVVETGKVLSSVGLPVGPDRLQLEALLVTLGSEKTLSPRFSIEELYSTAKNGDVDKVLYMLALGFDPNTKYKEHENETPLHAAAAAGQLVIVHLLIQAGAVADPMNERLYTPLMLAAESNHKHVMLYLIRVGAQVDSKGEDGMTCLHLAARSGNLEMCKILMNSGKVNVNVQDDGGWTPIVWASEHKHFIVVKFLIERGADPNIRDNEENTGLHWSAFSGSVDICQIYLDMGCDVNAANEHGDTPLHIAARQDSYECIVLFLSRGGNVEALNKANESPTQCCIDQNSQTYMALNMNQLLKKITSQYQHKAEKILYRDICKGKEQNPIQCVNGVDEELSPSDFLYIVENCETSPINIDRTITSLQSCHCEDDCTSTNCTCATISFKCWYDKEGCLLPEFNMVDPPMIFECNRACFCWRNCNNRVLQHGITCRLQLFRTKGKGWGVRTLRDIPKGTFICEYIGELISDSEADQREDDSYLFDLDNRDGETYCLDARYYGNVSRFINHLCEPNLVPVKVFVDHQDLSFPRIAFFSSREIKAYEELGFDYGEKFWVIKYKWFTCGCGSLKCKYSKDTIHDTLANYYRRLKEEQGEDIEHVQTT